MRCPFSLGGAIGTDTTWSGTVNVTGDVTVNPDKKLTILPGTVVKLNQGVRIQVSGTLEAKGTGVSPIVFTSYRDDTVGGDLTAADFSTGVAGDWEHLLFESTSTESVLEHVEVRYAGNASNPGHTSYYRTAIQINGGDPTFRDVRVVHSDAVGVGLYGGTPTLTRVSVDNARFAAFEGNLAAQPALTALTATNSGVNGYEPNGGTLASPAVRTWSFGGLTALVDGEITLAAGTTVTIPAGQVIKLRGYGDIEFYGVLNAVGTAARPIVFTSYRDDSVGGDTNGDGPSVGMAGDWDELYFDPQGAVVLQHVVVRYAGNDSGPGNTSYFRASVVIRDRDPDDSTVTMTDLQVHDADGTGVYVQAGAPQLTNVSVTRARHNAFLADLNTSPQFAHLSAAATAGNRVYIYNGTLTGQRSWFGGGLPIQLSGDITVGTGAELTIAAGQVVKFPQGAYLSVAGTLKAQSTAEQPIVFTSWRDDSVGGDANNDGDASRPTEGDWEALYLQAGSDASLLEHVQIRYPGNLYNPRNSSGYRSGLHFIGTNATARHVLVQYTDSNSVWIDGGAPTLDDVRVTGSRAWAFNANWAAAPTVSNLSAQDNAYDAFLLNAGRLTAPRQLRLTVTQLPYSLSGDSYVDAGATLTLDPGVVFKMGYGHRLQIDGSLVVNGTL